jgi:hypothetical protein
VIWFRDIFAPVGLIATATGLVLVEKWLPLRMLVVSGPVIALLLVANEHYSVPLAVRMVLATATIFSIPWLLAGWYWERARCVWVRKALIWVVPIWLCLCLVQVVVLDSVWQRPTEVAGYFVMLFGVTYLSFFTARFISRRRHSQLTTHNSQLMTQDFPPTWHNHG